MAVDWLHNRILYPGIGTATDYSITVIEKSVVLPVMDIIHIDNYNVLYAEMYHMYAVYAVCS